MVKDDRWVGDDLVDVIEEVHEHLSYNKIAGMCSVSNNMPWMIVQRRGACNLIIADRVLDALGYKLVIVRKEESAK